MKKVILKNLDSRHVKLLARYCNHPEIYKNTLNIPFPYTLAHAKQWVKKLQAEKREKNPTGYHLGIFYQGQFAGCIGLMKIVRGHRSEIGYWLAEDFWGKGIATLAVREMVKIGYKKFKLRRIFALVFLHNPASKRVLEKK